MQPNIISLENTVMIRLIIILNLIICHSLVFAFANRLFKKERERERKKENRKQGQDSDYYMQKYSCPQYTQHRSRPMVFLPTSPIKLEINIFDGYAEPTLSAYVQCVERFLEVAFCT